MFFRFAPMVRARAHDSGQRDAAMPVGAGLRQSRYRHIGRVAFLAGGALLNVLKEELPSERESSFAAFAMGAACCAVLLNRVR